MKYEEIVKQKLEILKKKDPIDIIVLGVESSCDETSFAVVKGGREVLSNVISSQIEIHKRFGGVVPEVASRNHIMSITNVLNEALEKANVTLNDIDAIAVTYGAGLMGALMVGVSFAKGLAYYLNLPLIKVNHIKGHIAGNYISNKELKPPFVCLLVSGGHTAILKIDDYLNHTLIGETLDDAVGEAYDKVARVLGLGYPGGPAIDKLAKLGKPNIQFVKHNHLAGTYNFSFSGLKTAVINYLHKKEQAGEEINVNDVCASFQCEAIDLLVDKTIKCAKESGLNLVALAGGVSANSYLREQIKQKAEQNGLVATYPNMSLCTDNAGMIASAGYYNLILSKDIADLSLSPKPNLKLKV